MPRSHNFDSDADDEDWDEGEEAWDDEDAEASLIECPKCGADIYEDAVRCPLCGEYITRSSSPWNGKPMWWRVVGLAGIVAIIATILLIAR